MRLFKQWKGSCSWVLALCIMLVMGSSGERSLAQSASASQNKSACGDNCPRFDAVYPILRAKCGNCHTEGNQGNIKLGDDDIRVAFQETQKLSYTIIGGTVGQAILVRVLDGSMPPGFGCTANFTANTNSADCLTDKEFALLTDWVGGGQRF